MTGPMVMVSHLINFIVFPLPVSAIEYDTVLFFPSYFFIKLYYIWICFIDLEARPWDFQVEECELRTCVDQFNNRRYSNAPKDEELEPVDTSVTSVLGTNVKLTEEFKQHYELWLQQEVFQRSINWDELLDPEACEI